MATVEELKLRVRELENELIKCKQRQCAAEDAHNRPRIDKMSAEVVDSNPYRWLFHLSLTLFFFLHSFIYICEKVKSNERQRLVTHHLLEWIPIDHKLISAVFLFQPPYGSKKNGHRGWLWGRTFHRKCSLIIFPFIYVFAKDKHEENKGTELMFICPHMLNITYLQDYH